MAKITLDRVTKMFGNIVAVQAIDLEIKDGEFIVFVGPSGCGKSTTLRMIAGLEEVSDGKIFFDGRDVTDLEPKDRRIAMVFQNYALYPHMSVFENMGFALRIAKVPKDEIVRQVNWAAGVLGLEDLLTRKPKQLSGGQMQRVALGRAIVRKPEVFLLDEPLSNLDAKLRVHMRNEIAKLHNKIRTSMVYVTHDQVEAMTLGDRIVVMHDGVVQQVGPPMELYDYPTNLFVARFIGSPEMNTIEGTIGNQDGRPVFTGGAFSVPLGEWNNGNTEALTSGREVTLGVRPEHIELGPAGAEGDNTLQIEVIERMGGQTLVIGNVGGLPVNAFLDRDDDLARGQQRKVIVSPRLLHLFDKRSDESLRQI